MLNGGHSARLAVRLGVLIGAVLVLTGCPGLKIDPLDRAERSRLDDRLRDLTHWQLEGRVSVSTDEDAWHASIHWRQQGDQYHIRFIAPLGQKTLDISGDTDHVVLRDSNGDSVEGNDIEQLVARQLGWKLPLKGLLHWVKASPDPRFAIDDIERSEEGLIRRLQQARWQADYRRYTKVDDLILPEKIFMENNKIKIRLIVRQWQLLQDA